MGCPLDPGTQGKGFCSRAPGGSRAGEHALEKRVSLAEREEPRRLMFKCPVEPLAAFVTLNEFPRSWGIDYSPETQGNSL